MKEYLFTIHLVGNDKNGNALVHVYAAWKDRDEQGWRNFTPNELKSLNLGRVIKGRYITTQMYSNEVTERLLNEYGDECSFLYL